LGQTCFFQLRESQAERKKENNHKIIGKMENREQWNKGKEGETKRIGEEWE